MVIGSLIAIAGLIWLVRTITFVMYATKTQGTIIEMERNTTTPATINVMGHITTSKGGFTYHPIFTFSDDSGIIHTQRTFAGSSSHTFQVGDKVTVLYYVSEPTRSEIDSFQTIWLGPLIAIGFGLLFAGFHIFFQYFFVTRKSKPVEDVNAV
jgi:hypothetical protein